MRKQLHPVIKRPLSVFVAVVIVSIVAITVSESLMNDAYKNEQSEKRAMRIWKNKIDGSRESNKIIDEYEKSYTNLVNRHIIGEEDRLSWFETIQATTNARDMPSVKYNISSQKLINDARGQHAAQGLKVYRSRMTLDIKMAHEGDLFAMLNNLESKAKGLYAVDKCTIEKIETGDKANNQGMRALCELSWYTFKSAEDREKI